MATFRLFCHRWIRRMARRHEKQNDRGRNRGLFTRSNRLYYRRHDARTTNQENKMKAAIARLQIAIDNLKENQVVKPTKANERTIKQLEKAIAWLELH